MVHLWEEVAALLKPSGKVRRGRDPDPSVQGLTWAPSSAASGQFFDEIVRVAVLREQADCFGMQVAAVEHHGRVATESFDSIVLEFAPGPSG